MFKSRCTVFQHSVSTKKQQNSITQPYKTISYVINFHEKTNEASLCSMTFLLMTWWIFKNIMIIRTYLAVLTGVRLCLSILYLAIELG